MRKETRQLLMALIQVPRDTREESGRSCTRPGGDLCGGGRVEFFIDRDPEREPGALPPLSNGESSRVKEQVLPKVLPHHGKITDDGSLVR